MRTRLILASGSPRRRELLEEEGIHFEVIVPNIAELDATSGLPPGELAMQNARLKAAAIAEQHTGCWVLGADTVVTLNGRLFGKPESLEKAREFLMTFSGRTHEVITGCALFGPDSACDIFHESTRVIFRRLTSELVDSYVDRVHVLDKAGAYALQEQGDMIITQIEGSRSNVVGLPMETLRLLFKKRGLL